MISNLQLLRAFCALSVVYYHTGNTVLGMHTEFGGVALFFCISGFIMAYIPHRGAGHFVADRVARIAPVYWVATLAFFFWGNSGMANPPRVWPLLWNALFTDPMFIAHWFYGNTGLNVEGARSSIAKSLLFIPYKDHAGDMHPLLGAGWTLNLEMFFYGLYALALAVRASIAPLIALVAVVAVWTAGKFGLLPGISAFYGNDYVLYFAYGIVCYYAWRAVDTKATWTRLKKGATIAGAFAVFFCYITVMSGALKFESLWLNTIVDYVVSPPAVLMAVLLLHSSGFRPQSKFGMLLGGASYSLYLFHLFVMETIRPVGIKWPWLNTSQSATGACVAMALSVAIGIAAYQWVERPLTRMARDAIKRRASARLAAV